MSTLPSSFTTANVMKIHPGMSSDEILQLFGANCQKKKLKLILNGGESKIGIESTVIDLTGKPTILRPGIIDLKKIYNVLKTRVGITQKNSKVISPGMLKKHYSPGIPIFLNQTTTNEMNALITFGKKYKNKTNYFNLSKKSDLKEAASNLYKTLRKIKKLKFKKIYIVKIPNKGPGIAINDRLKRAAKK